MSVHDLDHILATTRAVRRRLDLDRDVPQARIDECLKLAQQAPSGGNREVAKFVVVRDPATRQTLADIYRRGWSEYVDGAEWSAHRARVTASDPSPPPTESQQRRQRRVAASARHLAENLERVPVLVIPCVRPRTAKVTLTLQASTFGSVLPAVWSYMLAARARGLGTVLTTLHLIDERAAAELLGIPRDYQQVGLIPTAFATSTDFSPASKSPIDEFRYIDRWPMSSPSGSAPPEGPDTT